MNRYVEININLNLAKKSTLTYYNNSNYIMEHNNNKVERDYRFENPRAFWLENMSKLKEFETWICKVMKECNKHEISMPSIYLTEVADKELYLQPAPNNYCLYDFVDEFLEEGGIEVSYNSNCIRFRQVTDNTLKKRKSIHVECTKPIDKILEERNTIIDKTIGLLIIGWGTATIGIAKRNEIEELSKFRASQLGRYDWTRFSSKEELDWWIEREKQEAYRNICRIASSEFQLRLRELDAIVIGLKQLILKRTVDLNWFNDPVREKINNIFEFEQDSEPSLKELLVKFIESQNNDELKKKE